jgi:hypothetical protein
MAPPPAPNPDAQQNQAGQASAAARVPAPTHAQTVAALRHFTAIGQELRSLLSNPDLGRASIRDAARDGAIKLVANRILTAPQAVTMLADFPDKPLDQKKWAIQQWNQLQQARVAVLAHHGAAYAGQGEMPTPNGDNHATDIGGLMGHYGNA